MKKSKNTNIGSKTWVAIVWQEGLESLTVLPDKWMGQSI
jgi:hypothetical protein